MLTPHEIADVIWAIDPSYKVELEPEPKALRVRVSIGYQVLIDQLFALRELELMPRCVFEDALRRQAWQLRGRNA